MAKKKVSWEVNSVMETSDYDMFELHPQNRNVGNLKPLLASMSKHGFLSQYPMHCVPSANGKLTLKSGHHRLAAARKLGIPVRYILAEDNEVSIHELETASSAWNLNDYLASFVRAGNPDYMVVRDFSTTHRLPLSVCVSMLTGDQASSNPTTVKKFKTGAYKVTDAGIAHGTLVASLADTAISVGMFYANTQTFIIALSRIALIRNSDFSLPEFKRKLVAHGHVMRKSGSVAEYVDMFEKLYNTYSKNSIPLAFIATEDAKERQRMAVKHTQVAP